MLLQQAFQPGSGAVQAGFQRAYGGASELLEFRQLVTLDVVHDEDEAVFFAELIQRQHERLVLLCTAAEMTRVIGVVWLIIGGKHSIEVAGAAHQAERLPVVAPFIVNKLVIKDAAEPGCKVADVGQFRPPLVELYEHVLHEIFRICLRAGQTVGQAVEPAEMGLQKCCKGLLSLSGHRRSRAAVTDDQCSPHCAGRQLRLPQNDDSGGQNCALFRFFNPLRGNNERWDANC